MKYRLYFDQPNRHKIRIELEVPPSGNLPVEIRQSTWRPGRYELAAYAERVSDVSARTTSGKSLSVTRTGTHSWEVAPTGTEFAVFEYFYYATIRDAGSSRFDDTQVYINGVNLFFYFPDQVLNPCTFDLDLPFDYQVACGLQSDGNTFFADDYHQLVDAPLFASNSLQKLHYDVNGIPFYIWFQGKCQPDETRFLADFIRFSEAQLKLFGGFPVRQYHFLFQIRPDTFYHGVEHYNSTVIAIGPGPKLMEDAIYEDVLGVSSHELFHTWNVKAIRPADMQPYAYDGPNYCRLHYVTEGVTTYYGDLMLLKSGVWSLEEYLKVMNEALPGRYYKNDGRKHISLEQASFDSWVNGYKDAVPNRKISFYTKGALAAFIADVQVRKATGNRHSLDTVMRQMYERFGKTGIGYTREDYKGLLESVSGISFDDYFEQVISGTQDLEPLLATCADYLGLAYQQGPWPSASARYCGFLAERKDSQIVVSQIFEDGPAEEAGFYKEDVLLAINGIPLELGQFSEVVEASAAVGKVVFSVMRNLEEHSIELKLDPEYVCPWYQFVPLENPTEAQFANRQHWANMPQV